MWNNYTIEMQNRVRIEDHLVEARANALEAEARAADSHASWLTVAARRATGAASARAAAMRGRASARAAALRLAFVGRARAMRHRIAAEARHLPRLHLHRPTWGHRRA